MHTIGGVVFNLKKDFPGLAWKAHTVPDLAAECEEEETVDMLSSSLARIGEKVMLFRTSQTYWKDWMKQGPILSST